MYMMKGVLALFMSLAIGYVLCILAEKQTKGILRAVGYTLGTAIIILSLLYSLADSCNMMCKKGRMWQGYKNMKYGMFMKGSAK